MYLRSNLRGSTRIPNVLANQFASLHSVPIVVDGLAPVYVDLRDGHSHYLLRDSPYESAPYEKQEQRTFRALLRGGETAYDIGANLGFHLVLVARLVGPTGRVFAFEPNPRLWANLERTVSPLANTTLFRYALSDEQGESTLFVPTDHMKSSLRDWTHESAVTPRLTCQMERIDDLVRRGMLPVPDFIKCDVEGAELKVFAGAEETLDRARAPVILFEANMHTVKGFGLPLTAAVDFLTALTRARYSFFELLDDGYAAVQQVQKEHANILAVPDSRLAEHEAVTASAYR